MIATFQAHFQVHIQYSHEIDVLQMNSSSFFHSLLSHFLFISSSCWIFTLNHRRTERVEIFTNSSQVRPPPNVSFDSWCVDQKRKCIHIIDCELKREINLSSDAKIQGSNEMNWTFSSFFSTRLLSEIPKPKPVTLHYVQEGDDEESEGKKKEVKEEKSIKMQIVKW